MEGELDSKEIGGIKGHFVPPAADVPTSSSTLSILYYNFYCLFAHFFYYSAKFLKVFLCPYNLSKYLK